jgi:zinc and cadmium transporter
MLAQILVATIAGGVLSVLVAALVAYGALLRFVPRLLSFAVGALLGAALLNLLPEAIESGADLHAVLGTVLGGLIAFFVLEKLSLWRHAHPLDPGHSAEDLHHHGAHAPRPAGMLVVVGDSLHNFVDGVLIAAAFLADPALGWTTALAVIAHEIPQEIGDFLVLIDSGYSRRRALWLNTLSGVGAVVGGVAAYFLLPLFEGALPYLLALAVASFLYVAVADLVPDLQRRYSPRDAISQLALIGLGIALVALNRLSH